MALFARSTRILCWVVLATTAGCFDASAQQTSQRCEGTLCDLYYRNSPPPAEAAPAQPAAPTPLTVPTGGFLGRVFGTGPTPAATGATPSPAPFVSVKGGGILADKTDERCDGTLCDIYYHGAPPPRPSSPSVASAPDNEPVETTAAAAPDAETDAEPRTSRRKVTAGVQFAKPACVAPPGDPWRCYR